LGDRSSRHGKPTWRKTPGETPSAWGHAPSIGDPCRFAMEIANFGMPNSRPRVDHLDAMGGIAQSNARLSFPRGGKTRASREIPYAYIKPHLRPPRKAIRPISRRITPRGGGRHHVNPKKKAANPGQEPHRSRHLYQNFGQWKSRSRLGAAIF